MAPRARRLVPRDAFKRARRGWLAALVSAFVFAALLAALRELPAGETGLQAEVARHLGESGVAHPVTAVLLNFRLYDTWLEMGVLLLAAVALLTLQRARDLQRVGDEPPASAVLAWAVRLLVPVMVVASGFLLWLGTKAPGGAFQAGVVLGGAGVLLRLAGFGGVNRLGRATLHALLLLGFAALLALALVRTLLGRPMLSYPFEWEGTAILALETLIAVSVAVTVVVLTVAGRPLPGDPLPGDPLPGDEV